MFVGPYQIILCIPSITHTGADGRKASILLETTFNLNARRTAIGPKGLPTKATDGSAVVGITLRMKF